MQRIKRASKEKAKLKLYKEVIFLALLCRSKYQEAGR
jgi:hypothetical protein